MIVLSAGQIAVFVQLAVTATACAGVVRLSARTKWAPLAVAAVCLALAGAGLLVSDPPHAFEDFRSAYYPAGRAVLHSAAELRMLSQLGVSGFVNLPIVAYAFLPLSLLPLPGALALFSLLSLAAVWLAWRWLADYAELDLRGRWLLALLFCANGPLLYSLKEGNTSQFILLALVGGLTLLRSARPSLAGLVLGLAAVIKPPLLLFGVFFLLKRNARASAGFFGVIGLVCALSLARFGWQDNLLWFQECVLRFSHAWLGAFNVQSVPAFLLRLKAEPAVLGTWNAYLPPQGLAILAKIITAALFASAILVSLRRPGSRLADEHRRDLQYLVVICLALLGSPLSWSHYYCWLLVPAGLSLNWMSDMRASQPGAALGWLAIGLTTPLARQLSFPSPWMEAAYKDLGVSLPLLGALLWFVLLIWRLATTDGLHAQTSHPGAGSAPSATAAQLV